MCYEKYSLVGPNLELIFLLFHCRCHKFCSESGYSYYGVQALDWCFCGNNVPLGKFKLINDNVCNENPCPGDTSTKCGGAWRMHVYSISSGGTLPVCAPLEDIFDLLPITNFTPRGHLKQPCTKWRNVKPVITTVPCCMDIEELALVGTSYLPWSDSGFVIVARFCIKPCIHRLPPLIQRLALAFD